MYKDDVKEELHKVIDCLVETMDDKDNQNIRFWIKNALSHANKALENIV